MMNLHDLIEQLLFEEEGSTLDFKGEQYRFSGASDAEKSEILKDILAFANAFRRTDAYVLVGVREVKGGRSELVGVSNHLEDAHLQQFVNGKTQRPIEFSYRAVQHDGFQIGLIHIPVQRRPFYLKRDFGRLTKELVYVRRGSSTDVASPDEIATMGIEVGRIASNIPILNVFLVSGAHEEIVEKRIESKLINAIIPDDASIPDYRASVSPLAVIDYSNGNYYRELAKYYQERVRVRAFKLAIKNSGNIPANDVKVVFEIANLNESIVVCAPSDLPSKPHKSHSGPIQSFYAKHTASDVSIKTTPHGWRITCYLGKVRPKDMATTTFAFCLGALASQSLQLNAQIFSDDVPEPITEVLEAIFEVEEKYLSIQDLVRPARANPMGIL